MPSRYAAALLLLAACTADRQPLEPPPPRPTERRLPGPGPRTDDRDVVAENGDCVRCHAVIGEEWRQSQHRDAWDDRVFLAAFVLEPIPFCRRCHAPEVAESSDEPDPARHLGVGCVTCHVQADGVLGTRDRPGGADAHPVIGEPRLTGASWCSGCHEFAFPEPQDSAMQGTVAEHRESLHRDRSCQHCHMPLVHDAAGSHRSHRFTVQGDAAILRGALVAEARRSSARSIAVELRVTGAGHAVPTGDMFRRLEVRARAGSSTAAPVVLAREFRREDTPRGPRRLQIGDSRVEASGEPRHVELTFPEPIDAETVGWQVLYQRMGPHEAMLFGVDVAGEETVLASGVLAPPSGETAE
jgi:cytochrome c554/c'-like protein